MVDLKLLRPPFPRLADSPVETVEVRTSTVKITKTYIDSAVYRGVRGPDYRWDSVVSGFALRVYPSGRKVFAIGYWHKGRKRFLVLGPVGVLTLDEARERARRLLVQARDGNDPRGQRSAPGQSPTVAQLMVRYFSDHAEVNKKPRSVKADRSLTDCHILPNMGKRRLCDLDRDEIRAFHQKLKATPVNANRALSLLSKAFSLAEEWGWRKPNSNPCLGVKRFTEKSRDRFLTSEELRRLATVLQDLESTGEESPHVTGAIRLLLFTGCRMSEIRDLRWEDVDLTNGVLNLPDSKTGAKKVILSGAAIDLLRSLPREAGNPWVIVGKKPGEHLTDLERPWRRIRTEAGLDDVRLHDLRHTFASLGAGLNLSLHVIGGLLGHTQAETTMRYAHLANDPKREAANAIGLSILSAMTQDTTKRLSDTAA